MKIYVLVTPSHEILFQKWFMRTLQDDCPVIVEHAKQECPTAEFMMKGWLDTMHRKVDVTIRGIEENPEGWFVHSDVDVQFFQPILPALEKEIEGYDLVVQGISVDRVLCAGFFACRSNEKTKEFFRQVKDIMYRGGRNDQDTMTALLKTFPIDWKFLPLDFWSPLGQWNPGDAIHPPAGIIMHHAAYTIGLDCKLAQLRDVEQLQKGFGGITIITTFKPPSTDTAEAMDASIEQDIVQGNALGSWEALRAVAKADVCEPGEVENVEGIPTVRGMMGRAAAAPTDYVCMCNADIILFPEWAAAVEAFWRRYPTETCFLLVGQRSDYLGENREMRFGTGDRFKLPGELHPPTGIDYWVWHKSVTWDMPGFVKGASGYDNWMVAEALRRGFKVVDLTDATRAAVIHQHHPVTPHRQAGDLYERNRKLLGADIKTISDCNHRLVKRDGVLLFEEKKPENVYIPRVALRSPHAMRRARSKSYRSHTPLGPDREKKLKQKKRLIP